MGCVSSVLAGEARGTLPHGDSRRFGKGWSCWNGGCRLWMGGSGGFWCVSNVNWGGGSGGSARLSGGEFRTVSLYWLGRRRTPVGGWSGSWSWEVVDGERW